MSGLEIRQTWVGSDAGAPEFRHTTAQLECIVNGICLTRNENIWSRSVQDGVTVPTYPLALWFLNSWWRLLYEPLPPKPPRGLPGLPPAMDWRMAHEMGAANHGIVWPKIIFASDGQTIQIWASPFDPGPLQSVRYLHGLPQCESISIAEFKNAVFDFISVVDNRLGAVSIGGTALSELVRIIQAEQDDAYQSKYRRLEAMMGFDPDECPPDVMAYASELGSKVGLSTLDELAPLYGKMAAAEPLREIEQFAASDGVIGQATFTRLEYPASPTGHRPAWQSAVNDARALRTQIGNERGPIDTRRLYDLLGVASSDIAKWSPHARRSVSVGIPLASDKIKFIPRKSHPISKRFELSRYIADINYVNRGNWLTTTDLSTHRQKYQRAFAAEFLCPIAGLTDFMHDDVSDEAMDEASEYFDVSQQTIHSLLTNNHLVERPFIYDEFPYRI